MGGAGSCPLGVGASHISGNPDSDQSVALISSSWTIDDTPTKGWCNDSTGGCPTINQITSAMAAGGVTTNLGNQADFSRIIGLYLEKTGYGKITFQKEMNFTDRDALTWLADLDGKIDLNTRVKIALDADLIANLVDTQAQLVMYGLTFNNPKVLVNGAEDTSGVTSGLSYANGTLTFNVAHFTTFTAAETSSSSSSSFSTSGPPLVVLMKHPIILLIFSKLIRQKIQPLYISLQ